MTRLLHITSPRTALKTIRSGTFRAGPILGDAGLNAYMEPHPNGSYGSNHHEQDGAILEFEWTGPISTQPYGNYPPMDVLMDQHPHRAFLFVGTGQGIGGTPKHLHLVGVTLKQGHSWAEAVNKPQIKLDQPATWLGGAANCFGSWEKKAIAEVSSEVAQRLATPIGMEIVLPPTSPYHGILLAAFPNLR